ncbi:hypothetical protein QE152_g38601 [Popillia japonica]|uniref:BED-type domain-containing protein n=1 Tax=Popillia japonica TaxID=7064 RepID=A0AAW1HWK0_POPJA
MTELLSSSDSPSPCSSEAENRENSFQTPTLTLLDGKFFKYDSSSSNGRCLVATCVKCLPDIIKIKGSLSSTSNFISHLKRKHGEQIMEDYHQYAKQKIHEKQIKSAKTVKHNDCLTRASQDTVNSDIDKYFIHSMIPLNTVDDPFFI